MLLLSALACVSEPRRVVTDDTEPEPTETDEPPVTGPVGETLAGPVTAYALTDLRAERVEGQESILRVSWTQASAGTVQVGFRFEGEERQAPPRDLEVGHHEELLLGVPYETDLTWSVALTGALGADQTPWLSSSTGDLPSTLPRHQIQALDPDRVDDSVTWFLVAIDEEPDFGGQWWTTIMDREGRVVWARRSPRKRTTFYPRVSVDGDQLLLDLDSYWGDFDRGAASQIVALAIDGTELGRWDAPGLHHSFTQLPDHTLLYGSYVGGPNHYDEEVVAIAPEDGQRTMVFHCGAWLEDIGVHDQCASNTVSYDPDTSRFLVSWFSMDAVTEHAYPSGEVLRWFGDLPEAYAFEPADTQFWYQHGPHYLPDGHLLLSTHVEPPHRSELVVREYVVDEASRTLRQVAVLGKGEGVPGEQMGEAHRLSNGNTLHNFGTNAHLREYTPDGDVVWEADWDNDLQIGRTEPILVDLYELAPTRP
ncbi:MAG: hypothetical protein H6735_23285 [Alphaproteobacteria bacterium]|nr:hypothetical protein [Alphaproteobacteria bacterium]